MPEMQNKQLGTRLARSASKLGIRAGAQFKKSVSQQEENLGFDTRRRLRGDRIEGAQEAAGKCISNQSEHHRVRFGKEHPSSP